MMGWAEVVEEATSAQFRSSFYSSNLQRHAFARDERNHLLPRGFRSRVARLSSERRNLGTRLGTVATREIWS